MAQTGRSWYCLNHFCGYVSTNCSLKSSRRAVALHASYRILQGRLGGNLRCRLRETRTSCKCYAQHWKEHSILTEHASCTLTEPPSVIRRKLTLSSGVNMSDCNAHVLPGQWQLRLIPISPRQMSSRRVLDLMIHSSPESDSGLSDMDAALFFIRTWYAKGLRFAQFRAR